MAKKSLKETPKADKSAQSQAKKSTNIKKLVLRATLAVVFLIVFTIGLAGLGIYKLNWNNGFTKAVSAVFPFPAALVDNKVVSLSEFENWKAIYKHNYEKQGQPIPANFETQVIDELIDLEIMETEAKKLKLEVSKADLDDSFNKKAEANGGQEKFSSTINSLYGISNNEYRATLLYKEVLSKKLEQKLTENGNYLAKKDTDSKALAEKTLEEIKAGAKFEEKAISLSQDKVSAAKGGDLGIMQKGSIVKEVEDAAFALLPGNLGNTIVKSAYGYHVIMLVEKTDTTFHIKHILFKAADFKDWLAFQKTQVKIKKLI